MLDAHVQYELQRYAPENLEQTIRDEVVAVLDWLEDVHLNDVASPALVLEGIRRTVIEGPVSDELVAAVKHSVLMAYTFLEEDETRAEQVLPRQLFDQGVDLIIDLEDLRQHITHQFITSSVYSMLISHVLYHGIKDFILTGNVLAKKIPGASSLIKLGRRSLNSAAPQLEGNIDKQLIKFINSNLHTTIADSEKFLNKALDAKMMIRLGGEIWDVNSKDEMAELTNYVDGDALEVMVELGQAFWLHYRKTEFFYALVEAVVNDLFERYGDRSLPSLLDNL
ncbi:MAG: hypothetical protein KIT87_23730, partial [Anaerolineae bacterium]|nr:hypothetical protein [Anaerolineae bacterium]